MIIFLLIGLVLIIWVGYDFTKGNDS